MKISTIVGRQAVFMCLLMVAFTVGCQSGIENPSQPPLEDQTGTDGQTTGDTALTQGTSTDDVNDSGQDAPGIVPWGFYDIAWDEETEELRILPLRTAQFTLNIVEFLQPPGGDPLGITPRLPGKQVWSSTPSCNPHASRGRCGHISLNLFI